MSIGTPDIENIAFLARLKLSPAEIEEAAASISDILKLIDQMQSAKTEGLPPLSHAVDAVQRLRDDVVTEENRRDELQKLAPKSEQGFYLVPKVIE